MASNVVPMPSWGASPADWAHFASWLGLAEDLLPVVSNPRATISPDSTLKDLGKTPSRYNAQRQVAGVAQWTQHRATPEEIDRWSRERDYGISLQTRSVRAIDVDVTDEAASVALWDAIYARHPDLPHRSRSNSSKFLVAFELQGEFTKRKFKCEHGIVEFLAHGQQFVAIGTHPSGVRYEWPEGLPDALPVLSAEEFEALWSDLVSRFAVEASATTATSVKHQKLADVYQADPVARFLVDGGHVKKSERDGRLHITCPFEQDHTSDSGDTATTYWPAHTGGYANGHFHCLHAHCEHRADQEFLDAIGYLSEDLGQEFAAIADPDRHGSAPVAQVQVADPQPAAKPERFTFQPAHLFAQGKPAHWIVKGVLPQADLAVMFGESGSGKSFAALDMAVDVATGSPWRGHRVRQGRVAYIAAEGAGGFRNRLKAIAHQRQLDLAALPLMVLAEAPNLMEKQDAIDVARQIVAAGGASLVIVDTFAQVMPGANENAGEDVGRALAHCKGIHRATGALVMLVHHSGKDASKGARGWSGLRAAADVELEVVRADDARSLTVTKLKDGGRDGEEFAFRLDSVVVGIDEDDEEITSCVVVHGEGPVHRLQKRKMGAVEQIVMMAMDELCSLAGEGVDHPQLKAAAIGQMTREDGKRDRRGERVERALEGLIGDGVLRRDGVKVLRCE